MSEYNFTVIQNGNTIFSVDNEDVVYRLNTANSFVENDIILVGNNTWNVSIRLNGESVQEFNGDFVAALNTANTFISGNLDILVTFPAYRVLTKGDIIDIDMNGDQIPESYLVLDRNNSVCEVVMRDAYANNTFAPSGSDVYAGGNLDTRLNTTWYNTCSTTAKAAIVDKTFRQDKWYPSSSGSPDYVGLYQTSSTYYISLGNAEYGSEITRHVYALSVQDIIDYLEVTPQMTSTNTTLNKANIQAMFNNTSNSVWTRSARVAASGVGAIIVNCSTGRISGGAVTSSYQARPVFQIDLSKIEWTKE